MVGAVKGKPGEASVGRKQREAAAKHFETYGDRAKAVRLETLVCGLGVWVFCLGGAGWWWGGGEGRG